MDFGTVLDVYTFLAHYRSLDEGMHLLVGLGGLPEFAHEIFPLEVLLDQMLLELVEDVALDVALGPRNVFPFINLDDALLVGHVREVLLFGEERAEVRDAVVLFAPPGVVEAAEDSPGLALVDRFVEERDDLV